MKAWDIYSIQLEGWPEPHPAVVVSHPDRVDRKQQVEVIMCTSLTAKREAKPNEVILDESDGLDRPSLCFCDLIHTVKKTDLSNRRGSVTFERRRQIIRTIIASHGWAL